MHTAASAQILWCAKFCDILERGGAPPFWQIFLSQNRRGGMVSGGRGCGKLGKGRKMEMGRGGRIEWELEGDGKAYSNIYECHKSYKDSRISSYTSDSVASVSGCSC